LNCHFDTSLAAMMNAVMIRCFYHTEGHLQ
jgi:hypothetical protein